MFIFAKKIKGDFILSSLHNVRLNVALTFNVKPGSESFPEFLVPDQKNNSATQKLNADTFAEWDTWETIDALKAALEEYSNVTLIEADYSAYNKLREMRPDIVFNITEGFSGISREAQMPAILEMLGIPYTGSDPLTLATCLDKARTKEILSYYKIANPGFITINKKDFTLPHNIYFPMIVKPVGEGSSKGIYSSSFVNNEKELRDEVRRILEEYNQPALAEEFLPGREFTVALIGNGNETEVLPVVEISYADFPENFIPIYSYEAKWILDSRDNPLDVFSCPAEVSPELDYQIKNTALNAYQVMRCRDWSRIDIRLDSNGVPNIIEINPLPGILPDPADNSCFPKAARTAGYSYSEMLNKVLYSAARRYNLL
jgi:D-alanine-D-alanine ligase